MSAPRPPRPDDRVVAWTLLGVHAVAVLVTGFWAPASFLWTDITTARAVPIIVGFWITSVLLVTVAVVVVVLLMRRGRLAWPWAAVALALQLALSVAVECVGSSGTPTI